MLPSYNNTAATQQQREAVAKLMLHVGCAVRMDYGESSGAGMFEAFRSMVDYFGMDPELSLRMKRKDYNIEEWDDILYNALAASHPILYAGSSSYQNHAFVIHGYSDGLYYVNWGWGHSDEGYFDISILSHLDKRGLDAETSELGYNGDAEAQVFVPDNGVEDEETTSKLTGMFFDIGENMTYDNGILKAENLNFCISYLGAKTTSKYINIGYVDNSGSVINVGGRWGTDPLRPNSNIGTSTRISFEAREGCTYNLTCIESNDGENWKAFKTDPYVRITIRDGKAEAALLSSKPTPTVTVALAAESSGIAGEDNYIRGTVTNDSDNDFYGDLWIRIGQSDTMPEYAYRTVAIAVPSHGTKTFRFIYTPKSAGDYNVWVSDDYMKTVGRGTVTFTKASNPVLSLAYVRCLNATDSIGYGTYHRITYGFNTVPGTKAKIAFGIVNKGSSYEGDLNIRLYDSDQFDWGSYVPRRVSIPEGADTTVVIVEAEGRAGDVVGAEIQTCDSSIELERMMTLNYHYAAHGTKIIDLRYGDLFVLTGVDDAVLPVPPILSLEYVRCLNATDSIGYGTCHGKNYCFNTVPGTKAKIAFGIMNYGSSYEGDFNISLWDIDKDRWSGDVPRRVSIPEGTDTTVVIVEAEGHAGDVVGARMLISDYHIGFNYLSSRIYHVSADGTTDMTFTEGDLFVLTGTADAVSPVVCREGLKVVGGRRSMTLTADKATEVTIRSIAGVTVCRQRLKDRETRNVSLPAGVYVVSGKKVVVKE